MRIYKRGKSWYLDYTYKRKRIRKSVGRSKKMAELALKDIEVKIAKEEHLGIHDRKKIPFEKFAEVYLTFSKANKSRTSYERDIISLKVRLVPYFRDCYLSEITPQAIEKYKIERLESVKSATVNREIACLKHLFTKAIEWGYMSQNPAKSVKLLKEPPGRVRYLEVGEIQALLGECSPQLKPIVVVALNTGMRKSEILNLKWNDVNFREKVISMTNTKNNERRFVPINDNVYMELKRLSNNHNGGFVFISRRGEPYGKIQKGFQNAIKRARIKDFTFHDLRHTFASHLVMERCNLRTVQQLLGHKSLNMTMRYAHLSRAHLQEAVQKVGTKMAHQENVPS
ncbi:site-specific integrase [candidate division WOR-3 bacterium]|nr:site-specific integrase [candidate division WOR-3 bacterium]